MTHRTKVVALLITGASTLGLMGPQVAGAATSTYPPNEGARSFQSSDGGWHSGTSFGGLCVPAVNCPTVTNDYSASDGAGGSSDGYLRTRIGSLLGVGATSRGIYQSPAFTYTGAAGGQPDDVTLRVARRSTLGTLLAVSGNSADYSVDLVDTSGHAAGGLGQQRGLLGRSGRHVPGRGCDERDRPEADRRSGLVAHEQRLGLPERSDPR